MHSCVSTTEACIEKLLGLPLSPQGKFLLMHGSLQRREDHLTRAVAWSLLQEPLQKLESKLVAAVKAMTRTCLHRNVSCFTSPTAMGRLAFSGLRRMMLLMHLSRPLQHWLTCNGPGPTALHTLC